MIAKRLAAAALTGLLTGGCFSGAPPRAQSSETQGTSGFSDSWHAVTGRALALPSGTPSSIQDAGPDQLVLINFWASWCPPCKTEVPLLQRLSQRGDVQVLGVSRDLNPAYAAEALRKAQANYPDVMDKDGTYSASLRGLIPLNAIPASVLVQNGRAIAVHAGPFDNWKDVAEGIRKFAGHG